MTIHPLEIKNRIADFLLRCRITADFLTTLGLFFAFISAGFIFAGYFFWAGAFLLFSGLLDLLDGAVARRSGKASAFGGILDSSLDRYGDGFVLGAFVLYFATHQQILWAVLSLVALVGAFSISYIRARAECEIDSCRVGFWERGERIVWISLGLLLNNTLVMITVLGIGVQWTAWQRLRCSYQRTRVPQNSPVLQPDSSTRRSAAYWIKIVLLIVALFLLRRSLISPLAGFFSPNIFLGHSAGLTSNQKSL